MLFFKIDLCSATSLKRSQRELSIDVGEHRLEKCSKYVPCLPRFGLTPTTGKAFVSVQNCASRKATLFRRKFCKFLKLYFLLVFYLRSLSGLKAEQGAKNLNKRHEY